MFLVLAKRFATAGFIDLDGLLVGIGKLKGCEVGGLGNFAI